MKKELQAIRQKLAELDKLCLEENHTDKILEASLTLALDMNLEAHRRLTALLEQCHQREFEHKSRKTTIDNLLVAIDRIAPDPPHPHRKGGKA